MGAEIELEATHTVFLSGVVHIMILAMQHTFVGGGDERSSWVCKTSPSTCSEARQQHFGRAPEKILPGLRHGAAQVDSKTGCGKAAPGEIPTGVKSSRATWLLIDGVYESRWSQCFILVKLSDSRNRNGNICKLTFSGCGSLMKICSLSLYIIGQLRLSQCFVQFWAKESDCKIMMCIFTVENISRHF